MVTDEARRPIDFAVPLPLVLGLIAVAFALMGLVLRYAAYAHMVPDATIGNFANGLCRWDCNWYVKIAESGYDPFPVPNNISAGNWAFFPLYPLFVGLLRIITGLPTMPLATATSILLSAASAFVAWPLLEKNLRAYTLYCAFLLSGPFSIYFTTFYTEVAFILLSNCVFLALRRSNYVVAGAFAALLSATRIVGVFIVFAIAIQGFMDYRAKQGSAAGFMRATLRQPQLVLAVFLAPLGLFAYMGYLYFLMGDGLAFQHVQRAWARVSGNPLDFLWQAITWIDRTGFWISPPQQLATATFCGLALTGLLAWRRQYAAVAFCLVCIVLPLTAGMASMLRFVVALSPLMLALMGLLARSRLAFLASLCIFIVADYFCTIGWLTEYLSLV